MKTLAQLTYLFRAHFLCIAFFIAASATSYASKHGRDEPAPQGLKRVCIHIHGDDRGDSDEDSVYSPVSYRGDSDEDSVYSPVSYRGGSDEGTPYSSPESDPSVGTAPTHVPHSPLMPPEPDGVEAIKARKRLSGRGRHRAEYKRLKAQLKSTKGKEKRYRMIQMALAANQYLTRAKESSPRYPRYARRMYERMMQAHRKGSSPGHDYKYPLLHAARAILERGHCPKGMEEDAAKKHALDLLNQYLQDSEKSDAPGKTKSPQGKGKSIPYRKNPTGIAAAHELLKEHTPKRAGSKQPSKPSARKKASPKRGRSPAESDSDSEDTLGEEKAIPGGLHHVPDPETGLFDATKDAYRAPINPDGILKVNDQVFYVLETSGHQFNCAFYSLGLSRLEAANLLLQNLANPLVRQYVGEQLQVALMRQDGVQLPQNQEPFAPLRSLIKDKNDLINLEIAPHIFNAIEEHTGQRPRNPEEALKLIGLGIPELDPTFGGILQKNLDDIAVKETAFKNLCQREDMVRHYITEFVAQPNNTMEFQHDMGDVRLHSVLDAIALLRKHSLKVYQPYAEAGVQGQMILRHEFNPPVIENPMRHILHTGGGAGVGHFSLLRELSEEEVTALNAASSESEEEVVVPKHTGVSAPLLAPKISGKDMPANILAALKPLKGEESLNWERFKTVNRLRQKTEAPQRRAVLARIFNIDPLPTMNEALKILKDNGWPAITRAHLKHAGKLVGKSLESTRSTTRLSVDQRKKRDEFVKDLLREDSKLTADEMAKRATEALGLTVTPTQCRNIRTQFNTEQAFTLDPKRKPLPKGGGKGTSREEMTDDPEDLVDRYTPEEIAEYYGVQLSDARKIIQTARNKKKRTEVEQALIKDWRAYKKEYPETEEAGFQTRRTGTIADFLRKRRTASHLNVSKPKAHDILVRHGLFVPTKRKAVSKAKSKRTATGPSKSRRTGSPPSSS